jgi:hypothetical protein
METQNASDRIDKELSLAVPEVVKLLRNVVKGKVKDLTPEQKWGVKMLWDGMLVIAKNEKIKAQEPINNNTKIILDFTKENKVEEIIK